MQEKTHLQHHMRGFTMIELVITLAIMGIVAAIAIPSYNQWLVQERIQNASGRLQQDMSFAEAYAVRSGQMVQVSVHGSATGCAWSIDPSVQNVQQNIPQMSAAEFTNRYGNIACSVLTGATFSVTPTGMVYALNNTVTDSDVTFGSTGRNASSYGYWLVQMGGAGNIHNCAVSSPTNSVCNLS